MHPKLRKENAIIEAYGREFWESLSKNKQQGIVINDGWYIWNNLTEEQKDYMDNNNITHASDFDYDEHDKNIEWFRPHALQGIQNNGGWSLVEEYPIPMGWNILVQMSDGENYYVVNSGNVHLLEENGLKIVAYQLINKRHF